MWKLGISLLSFRVLCLHRELYSISSLEKQYIGLSLFLFFNIAQLTEHLTGKKLTGARILTIGIGMGWDGRLVKHWSTSVFISGSVQRIERKLSAVFFFQGICPLPPQTGHCRGYFPRYHFDEASGQCEKFIYGGCGGNENNFKTLKECQKTCKFLGFKKLIGLDVFVYLSNLDVDIEGTQNCFVSDAR